MNLSDLSPDAVKALGEKELNTLSQDIRSFLVEHVSKTGGHLSSNLGTVELTLALVRAFDFPKDRIVFDVGHQSYVYKMLTGRMEAFDRLRQFGGLSGFPKRSESAYDFFDSGHSSNSISAALGMAVARDLHHEDYHVVSVIGDGSLTGGEAYEALNNASNLKSGMIIVLNDNEMSISKNVGGLSRYLTTLRSGKGYNKMKVSVKSSLEKTKTGSALMRAIVNTKDSIKEIVMPGGMVFENLGLKYLGPVDGHDVQAMEKVFNRAKELNRPVIIHVLTKKGKGYLPAEKHPSKFHGIGSFDPVSGREKHPQNGSSYSEIFGRFLTEEAASRPEIVAVTAAMGPGVGMLPFQKQFPDRFYDVGIAEAHAVTFASGLSLSGMHPYVAIYSTFLQRAYDQVLEDVCLQNLPVTFLIDRAGISGADGETHQGIFDLAYLGAMPNITVAAPKDGEELTAMLKLSLDHQGPLAIRYPKGNAVSGLPCPEVALGKAEVLENGRGAAILAMGSMVENALETSKILKNEGLDPAVVNMRFLKPFDEDLVRFVLDSFDLVVTLEDGVLSGGFGASVSAFKEKTGGKAKILSIGVPDTFVPQGSIQELQKSLGMDAVSISERILQTLHDDEKTS